MLKTPCHHRGRKSYGRFYLMRLKSTADMWLESVALSLRATITADLRANPNARSLKQPIHAPKLTIHTEVRNNDSQI